MELIVSVTVDQYPLVYEAFHLRNVEDLKGVPSSLNQPEFI